MSKQAAHSRALLSSLQAKVTASTVLSLTNEERRFLIAACAAALAGEADPLRIGRSAGGQHLDDGGMTEARMVHEARKSLGSIRAACEAVGARLNRDGSKSGAVEKTYKRHRSALEAADMFYQGLRSGAGVDQMGAHIGTVLRGI